MSVVWGCSGHHLPELAALEVLHRLHDFLARVHDEGAIADDRLIERRTAQEQHE